jgi:hypothetical protein
MPDANQPANWYADPTGRHQHRYWNGSEWTDQVADDQVTATDPPTMPSPGTAPAPQPGPVATKVPGNPLWAWIAGIGGVALIVGSFLNALNANVLGLSVDKNYFDGDGPLELVLGIAIVVLAVLVALGVLSRRGGWFVVGLGVVATLIAVADVFDVKDKIDQVKALGGTGSIGPALWLCLAGGIVAVVGGALASTTARTGDATSG